MFGGWGSAQQPAAYPQHGQIQPFGGRDPFGEMDSMMSPFGMFGGGRGGGGMFGDLFGEMDRMMGQMDGMMMGHGGSMQGSMRGAGSGMMMMGSSNGGGGGYSCQTMVMSSSMGQDGRMRTEQFSSSTVGDHNGRMREVQQAYTNSHTGVNKMSLERQLGEKGRKMVKEQNKATGEERTADMYKGMSEEEYPEFERDWNARAAPRLPQHSQGMRPYMLSDGAAGPAGYPSRGQHVHGAGGSAGYPSRGQHGHGAGAQRHRQSALPTAPAQHQAAPSGSSASSWR